MLPMIMSCGGDDPSEPVLSIDKAELSLNKNIDGTIKVSGVNIDDCTAFSSDEFVADITKGNVIDIHGNHVGECVISVLYKNQKAECKVNVSPLYDYLGTPLVSLGISKEDLKAKVAGTIQSESANSIEYKEESSIYDTYHFENDKLVCIGSQINVNYEFTDMSSALIERYKYVSSSASVYWFTKTDLMIRMNERGGNGGYRIIYAKDADVMAKYYQF